MSAAAGPLPAAPATPDAASAARQHLLLTSPILPTLLRLALPNLAAMLATAFAAMAETGFVGSMGVASLAGMALVFPMVMLLQMLSAGAMGGGVSSAVSRALGAGDTARANALAVHALWIGLAAGLVSTAVMLSLGPALYALLGGQGEGWTWRKFTRSDAVRQLLEMGGWRQVQFLTQTPAEAFKASQGNSRLTALARYPHQQIKRLFIERVKLEQTLQHSYGFMKRVAVLEHSSLPK